MMLQQPFYMYIGSVICHAFDIILLYEICCCSVKPAIFDLFLAFAIATYLAFVYLILNVVSLCVGVCM